MVEYDSLREFIRLARDLGETRTFEGASWDLELACINEMIAEKAGPLLVFDGIPGHARGYRVVTNVISTLPRTRLALGVSQELRAVEVLDVWRRMLKSARSLPPVEAKTAPIRQNIFRGDQVDLLKFPTPKWHPADGGRYLGTGAIVILRDPDAGWVNCAINRCMLVGENQIAIQMGAAGQNFTIARKYRERNLPCPIAVAISPDPLLMIAGGFKIPWGQSEYDFAGGLRGRPVETSKGVVTDLPLPAFAEIVLEGVIDPGASCDEGPFGEWTGYIVGKYTKGFPKLMRVDAVLHADDPILLGVRPLKPPAQWYAAVPLTNAAGIWNELEAGGHRGIKAVWTHVLESFSAIWTVVSIEQLYKGHSKEIGVAAAVSPAAGGWGAFTIVVDDDIDATNFPEVMWTLAMRCRLDRDVQTIAGVRSSALFPWATKEERNSGRVTGSRMIFDACKDFDRKDDFPPMNTFDQKTMDEISRKFGPI